MGHCPSCGTVFNSTEQAAQRLGVTDGRVRGILHRQPWRLQGGRVGWGWLVPADGVTGFQRQREGERVAAGKDEQKPSTFVCPGCGERLLSPKMVATELGVTERRVQAIMAHHPEWLRAFRVGHRWYALESGVEIYRARQQWFKVLGDQVDQEYIPSGAEYVQDSEDGGPVKVEVIVKPEVCNCGAYPFPHRKGGGDCVYNLKKKKCDR